MCQTDYVCAVPIHTHTITRVHTLKLVDGGRDNNQLIRTRSIENGIDIGFRTPHLHSLVELYSNVISKSDDQIAR